MSDLSDAFKRLINTDEDPYCVVCTVVAGSVDTVNMECDCQPVNSETKYTGISLAASPYLMDVSQVPPVVTANPANGMAIIPKDNSLVVVALTSKHTGFIAMFSAINSIKLLDGSRGGLVRVIDLVTKLNAIENWINTFVTHYNAHLHTVSGGATLVPTVLEAVSPINPVTARADIENGNITHGAP